MLDDACSSSGKSSNSKKSFSVGGRKSEIFAPQKGSMASFSSRTGCSKRTTEFKRRLPLKSPEMPATFRTVQCVYHQDSFFKLGDIVRLYDEDETEDEALPYFAQISGLMVDQFAEKYAALTWLLPTKCAPADGSFHPDHFILGPTEAYPRPLACCVLERPAPSNFDQKFFGQAPPFSLLKQAADPQVGFSRSQ